MKFELQDVTLKKTNDICLHHSILFFCERWHNGLRGYNVTVTIFHIIMHIARSTEDRTAAE